MKTDRFDDELRRKLLGLPPPETKADDVDRIFGYVKTHRPGSSGWGRGLLYGTVGALLLGSVLYNVNQYHTNKNLYVTLDSLRQQVAIRPGQPVPPAPATPASATVSPRPDTVYITRYRYRLIALPQPNESPATVLARIGEPIATPDGDAPVSIAPKSALVTRTHPNSTADYPGKIAPADLNNNSKTRSGITSKLPDNRLKTTRDIASATPNRQSDRIAPKLPVTGSLRERTPVIDNAPVAATQAGKTQRQLVRDRSNIRADQTQLVQPDNPSFVAKPGQTRPTNAPASTPGLTTNDATAPKRLVVDLLQPRGLTRPNPNNGLTLPTSLPVANGLQTAKADPAKQASKRSFHLTLPHVSVAKSSLFAGVGAGGGNEHLGGSVLGEWRVSPRWSVQAGLTYSWLFRERYDDDERFETRTQQDFRMLYAPNVPRPDEIHDIHQTYQLFQLPLTVAYHYSLGRDWSLRFGLGTALDLNVLNRVGFKYRENGPTSLLGLYEATEPTRLLNSLTVSAGIERQWKSWLFRASPFISPQLRPVSYKPDNLYWGGQLQVLRRFGGRK
jgi:hypothetical protein